MTAFQAAALLIGVAACVTDIRSRRVPNWLTFTSAAAGVALHALLPGGHGPWSALTGLATGLAVFFPFFALGGLGAGDVKLMAALGAWLGWQHTVWTAIYGSVAGGVLAVVVGLSQGYLGTAFANLRGMLTTWWLVGLHPIPEHTLASGRGPRLPYALPIFAGLLVTLWRH